MVSAVSTKNKQVNMSAKRQINKDILSKEELEDTSKELAYIKSHLDEYKKNNRWEDLKAELVNEKTRT